MFDCLREIPYQTIAFDDEHSVTVKRLDLIHPTLSGNKFFKLKHNLLAAQAQGKTMLIGFGGAYSNHIHALAYAAQACGFAALGLIRGDELADKPLNPTLQDAVHAGMKLEFLSRSDYRRKHTPDFLAALQQRFPDAYILPEGGNNELARQGCEEILSDDDRHNFDVICCAVGTGGTFAGLINASFPTQKLIGFAALNSDYLTGEVKQWANKDNWHIYPDSEFGGYGRFDARLTDFIQDMQNQNLPLEPIYTAKALYRLHQLLQNNAQLKDLRILFIHSGGLQGYRNGVITAP